MGIWVDTDFGFDDLWAMLVLRHLNVSVDGVSLVAGNVPLPQVRKNAGASQDVFAFDWPLYIGASKPLRRSPETAERILGKLGMLSRGLQLPEYSSGETLIGGLKAEHENTAVQAMATWLRDEDQRHVLALGPLTNIALLLENFPEAAQNIAKLTWMGGSGGRGNHSQYAEYNAIADPEALEAVANSNIPFRMIDLEVCRQVTFKENDIPRMHGRNSQLLSDLMGGYLDIAISRGRASMAIYDPVAALAVGAGELFDFTPASLTVHAKPDDRYGQTVFSTIESTISKEAVSPACKFEYATSINTSSALMLCLDALQNA